MSIRNKFLKDFNFISSIFKDNISVSNVLNYTDTLGISYFELNKVSSELAAYFLRNFGNKSQYIGVSSSDYFLLPCIILGIWKCGFCFAAASSQYTKKHTIDFLNFLRVKYLITDCNNDYDGKLICHFSIAQRKFFIWGRESRADDVEMDFLENISYGIMTSGSTGEPKIIQVPWSCILPNAVELGALFQVNEFDCIFQASPYSFDPFFIELLLTFLSGCSLTVVSNDKKLCPSKLLRILFDSSEMNQFQSQPPSFKCLENESYFNINIQQVRKKSISILQMTPSVFKRWSDKEIQEIILSVSSPLRILILGGEKFPRDILNLKCSKNTTRIFNIYGITEMSCWAFINEVTASTPKNEISIGKPLNDVIYKIIENELFIGSSTRICVLNGEKLTELKKPVFRKTGDIVRLFEKEVYYVCRNNQIVKKFGMKISLTKIEDLFKKSNNFIKELHCIYDEENLKLGLFYKSHKPRGNNISYKIQPLEEFDKEYKIPKNDLKDIELPDYLIEMAKTPLNSHGKYDSQQLLKYLKSIKIEKSSSDLEVVFRKLWLDVLDLKSIKDMTSGFTELGGNSVLGLSLINKLEDVGFDVPQEFITILLSGKSYDDCLKCLSLNVEKSGSIRKKIKISPEVCGIQLLRRWKYDLEKCVDASVAIFYFNGEGRIVVGSHSSKLCCLQPDSGQEIWTTFLGGRIQSDFKPTRDGKKGFIGCYDHFVYCIDTSNGSFLWKFKTGDVVKSTPCLSTDERIVYVGSYDRILYCLSATEGKIIASLKLSQGGIFCSGVISESPNNFYIGTLDGVCVAINQSTNQPTWKITVKSPVFASPCLISEKNEIIFCEVLGNIHCLNTQDGVKIWTFKANGNVYSSPVLVQQNSVNHIVFGCHDAHLYCLKCEEEPKLKWKQQMESSIFAKPSVVLESSLVCVATTKGTICLCDLVSSSIKAEFQLDGEVFSSPVFYNNTFVVGCRDNNIYCLNLSQTKI